MRFFLFFFKFFKCVCMHTHVCLCKCCVRALARQSTRVETRGQLASALLFHNMDSEHQTQVKQGLVI